MNSIMKLGKQAKVLVAIAFIRAIIDIFEDTYVTSRLAMITGQKQIAAYYMAKYIACMIGAILLLNLVRKKALVVLRIGMFVDAIYLFAFANITNEVPVIMAVGAVHGVAIIAYYLPLELVIAIQVSSDERHRFLSISSVVAKLIAIVMPIIMGKMVTIDFVLTVEILIILAAIQLGISFALSKCLEESSAFSFISFIQAVIKDRKLKKAFWINILRGVCISGTQTQIINIVIFQTFGSEYSLGKISSIIAVLSMMAVMLFGKVFTEKDYNKIACCITAVHCIIVVFFLILPESTAIIIVVKLSVAIMMSIISIIISGYYYKVIAGAEEKAGVQVLQQIGLNLGRILSWIIVAATTAFESSSSISLFLMNLFLVGLVVLLGSSKEFENKGG